VLLHRVTEEFKRTVQAEYRWKSDNPLLNADSLMEITKDRENGTVDYFIPLYYEPESHRLNETRYESKVYGWKKSDIYDELPM
jgi:predicted solute-binding protein